MSEIAHCPICRMMLPASAPEGFCPVCAFQRALNPRADGNLSDPAGDPVSVPQTETAQWSELARIRSFGDFELLGVVASGGMGTVFKARQIPRNRIVALKVINAGLLASEDVVTRFKAEAELAAGLNHPHIVPIHEIGQHEGRHYFSMTLIDGPTLSQALQRKPMPTRRATQLVVTLARAVHYAHQRGVLHRDLKPGNVLLDAEGQPHLTDFGLAKLIQAVTALTHTHALLGTPAYLSPEQARGAAKEVTTAADIYGLGAILYETLTGKSPFEGGTSLETMRQVLDREPRRLSSHNPHVDRDLETICLKCLAKQPTARYSTALGVAEDLERWLRGEAILARATTSWEKTVKWAARKPALAASLVSTFVLLLTMAIGGPIMALRIAAERTRAEQSLYVLNVRLAGDALAQHDLFHMRESLQRIATSPRQSKVRGWEYRYLMGRSQSGEVAVLGRHASWITDLGLSPDGKQAATISEDGVVNVWDLATRTRAQSWHAHGLPVTVKPSMPGHALAFAPDGRILATGGRDATVRFWDISAPQPKQVAELEKMDESCTRLAFSPDGGRLAGASLNGQVSLWSLSNSPPALINRWPTRDWGTLFVSFSADGKSLMTAPYGQPLRLWEISDRSLAPTRELSGYRGTTGPAAFSRDGRWLVAAESGAHFLRRWDYAAHAEQPHWPTSTASFATLAFSGDGSVLASGLFDGEIILWDLVGGHEPVTLMGHEELVSGLAFSPNGKWLVSASVDRTVRLWDRSQTNMLESSFAHGFAVVGLCFSPDCRYLASVAREQKPESGSLVREQHTVKLWSVPGMVELASVVKGGQWNSFPTFGPDGRFLAADDSGKSLKLYKIPSLELITNLSGSAPAFAAAGTSLYYASGRRIIRRDSPAATDAVETTVSELSAPVATMAISPDGNLLACTCEGDDGIGLEFWDARQRLRLGGARGRHEGQIFRLAFSPNNQWLASAAWDGKVGIWDVARRQLIQRLSGHNGDLYSVVFSPDGHTLASCGEDGTIRLWSVSTLDQVATLRMTSRLGALAFSADGQWLAAGALDGAVHVWRAPALEEFATKARRSLIK